MTDLLLTLPSFPTKPYTHLIPSLERTRITTSDLLTLEPTDIAKRARLPLLDVTRLVRHVVAELQSRLGLKQLESGDDGVKGFENLEVREGGKLRSNGRELLEQEGGDGGRSVSMLDVGLDKMLGGGVKRGALTEFVGESGSGKTQILLTLLLSVQTLPQPTALDRHGGAPSPPVASAQSCQSALYISTEAPLSTPRLQQILSQHPRLVSLPLSQKPSLDRIHSIQTPDLESQDHIIYYQVPVAIKRYNVGLIVIDSIAANYRAEQRSGTGGGEATAGEDGKAKSMSVGREMGERADKVVKLGRFLQELARRERVAVVVANQVADRFMGEEGQQRAGEGYRGVKRRRDEQERWMSSPMLREREGLPSSSSATAPFSSPSPAGTSLLLPPSKGQVAATATAAASQTTPAPTSTTLPLSSATDPLLLDHQLRFFTGWGDLRPSSTQLHNQNLKTPCLGLPWANQLACRVALIKEPSFSTQQPHHGDFHDIENPNNDRDSDPLRSKTGNFPGFQGAGHGEDHLPPNLSEAQKSLIRDQREDTPTRTDSGNPTSTSTSTTGAAVINDVQSVEWTQKPRRWRRTFKVAFSGYGPRSTGADIAVGGGGGGCLGGMEFEIWEGGLRSLMG